MKFTGLLGPDTATTRQLQLMSRRYRALGSLPRCVIQPIQRIHTQPALPSCGGESASGRFHGLTGFDASGRDLWREAQRRALGTFDPSAGVLLEWVVEAMVRKGLSPYRPGEEENLDRDAETWVEAHDAHDLRQPGEHYRLDIDSLEDLYSALARGLLVFDGGGVTAKFMRRGWAQFDEPAGLDELGGDSNGHAQGIVGYWLGSHFSDYGDVILYQGSWGDDFAGCNVPKNPSDPSADGYTFQPGCFWAKAEVWRERWDAYAIEVSR